MKRAVPSKRLRLAAGAPGPALLARAAFAWGAATLGCGGAPPLPPPPPAPPPIATAPVATPPTPPAQTPDAPFRENPPQPGPAVVWAPPKIVSWTMPNGVRVLFVEKHDLPIISLRVVSAIGAGDTGLPPAQVAFTGSLLEQGAGKRSALEISDDYEALGVLHSAGCEFDSCSARVRVLSSRLGPALDILSDVVLHPTFPDAEIDRVRKRWLGSLQQEKNSPGAMEQNAVAAALFGRAHPYGHSLHGVASDVEKLSRADIVRAYGRVLSPRATSIVVAGDVTASDLKAALEPRFGAGAWKAAGGAGRVPVPRARPLAKGGARVVLVDVPGAAQSQVFVAEEGAPYATADRVPLGVMNLILGGMFSSRINLDLREAKAYTYGAYSHLSMRHGAGPFLAGGAIFAEHTADAAQELLAQVTRIRDQPVSAEELADAKENARLALPARFETVEDVTSAMQDLAVYGLPLDEYDRRAAQIDAVTAADVQRVAKQWLHPESLRVFVTGDRARVEKDLTALGPIEVRDAYGDVVKPAATGK